jgi:hypothetical protein
MCNPNDITFATYATLCMDFDLFVELVADRLEVVPTNEQIDRLEIERIENIDKNKRWIGSKWTGSDTMPGRFMRELNEETLLKMNEKYKNVLDFLATHDHPTVRNTYNVGR